MNNSTYPFKRVATQAEAQEILSSLSEIRGAWEQSLSFNEMNRIFRKCDKILAKYRNLKPTKEQLAARDSAACINQ